MQGGQSRPTDKRQGEKARARNHLWALFVSPGKHLADHTGGLVLHQSIPGKAFKHECLKITCEDTNYGFAGRLAPAQRGKKKKKKDKALLTCSLAVAFRT